MNTHTHTQTRTRTDTRTRTHTHTNTHARTLAPGDASSRVTHHLIIYNVLSSWPGDTAESSWPGDTTESSWPGDTTESSWPGDTTESSWPGDTTESSWPGDTAESSWPGDTAESSWPDDTADHRDVRVLCWIMTAPEFLWTRAVHVRNTWGRGCNVLLFASDYEDDLFSTINITVPHGREYLPTKTFKAFDYVYRRHLDDADWFFKADDDTYAYMDNMRSFLNNYDSNTPMYVGHQWMLYSEQVCGWFMKVRSY